MTRCRFPGCALQPGHEGAHESQTEGRNALPAITPDAVAIIKATIDGFRDGALLWYRAGCGPHTEPEYQRIKAKYQQAIMTPAGPTDVAYAAGLDNAATMAPAYSSERPKEEGWYWMAAPYIDEAVMHTSELDKIFKQMPQARGDRSIRFYGPLPQPRYSK